MARFVRFRSPTPNTRGARVGVFALANGLAAAGVLSEAEARWLRANNDWYDAAYDEPTKSDPDIFDREVHAITECWFRSSALSLIERVAEYLELLDAHGIAWERVESDDPGHVLYEDDVQIVVAPPSGDPMIDVGRRR